MEYLFRGYSKSDNKFYEGYLFCIAEDLNPFIMLKNSHGESHEVIPETVGQYTGLTDKNGKRIFEGDIISAITLDTGEEQRAVVCFGNFMDENNDEEYIGFYIEFCSIKTTITQLAMEECKNRIEIIGNIFDNPELLDGE